MSPLAAVGALAKTWRGWVILVVVGAQLALPLLYYVARRDPHDERFAWRMFSPMRMARCTSRFALDDKPLVMTGLYHEAWLELAQRGRFGVIEAMGADLCAKHPGSRVRVTLDCTYLDRPARSYGVSDICATPEL